MVLQRCMLYPMKVDDHAPETSLYKRIGGYDVIAAIIDDLFAPMRADPRFARFGAGRSVDSRQRAQQLTVDLICSASGGTLLLHRATYADLTCGAADYAVRMASQH